MKISQLTLGTIGANDFVPIARTGTNYRLNLSDSISEIIATKVNVATSKTLTVNNTITLSGTDSATLNIGAGGTLGSAAYTSSGAYAASSHTHTSSGITDASTGGNGLLDSGLLAKYDSNGYLRGEALSSDTFVFVGEAGVYTGFLTMFCQDHAYESSIIANPGAENTVVVVMPTSGGTMATQEYSVSNYLPLSGGTITGSLTTPKVVESSAAQAWNASTVLNFNSTNKWIILGTLTGDTTITTSNRGLDKELTVVILADASTRTLTFSESWTWIGGNPPANLAAGKRAILSLRCVGSNAADVLASWAVQP